MTKPSDFGTIYRGLINFPETAPYFGRCKYNDCVHLHEPDCAVIEAVNTGEIRLFRYRSYVALRTGNDGEGGAI
ncbi:hypothetical protein HYR99_38480 [Candidatus Poribacteria bacterium]|nr:hypothetical protein [Candidatus Poribacteria bacterium]